MCCWDSPGTCSAPDYELLFRGCGHVYHIFTIFGFALDVRWRREYFTCYPLSCHCLDLLARSSAIHGSPSVLSFLAGTRWPSRWPFGSIFVPYLSLHRWYEGGLFICLCILHQSCLTITAGTTNCPILGGLGSSLHFLWRELGSLTCLRVTLPRTRNLHLYSMIRTACQPDQIASLYHA